MVFPSLEEFSTVCCDPCKDFSVVNEAEVGIFLEFSCFFYDPMNVGYICWIIENLVGVHKVLFAPSEHLWWLWGLILNAIAPFLPSCWDFTFALGHGVSFIGGIQYSPADGCSVASWDFSVLTGEDKRTSFYSPILFVSSPLETRTLKKKQNCIYKEK